MPSPFWSRRHGPMVLKACADDRAFARVDTERCFSGDLLCLLVKRLPDNPRPPAGFVVSEGVVRGRLARAQDLLARAADPPRGRSGRALPRHRPERPRPGSERSSRRSRTSMPADPLASDGPSPGSGFPPPFSSSSAPLSRGGLVQGASTVDDPPPFPPPLHRPRLTTAEPPVAARPAPPIRGEPLSYAEKS